MVILGPWVPQARWHGGVLVAKVQIGGTVVVMVVGLLVSSTILVGGRCEPIFFGQRLQSCILAIVLDV